MPGIRVMGAEVSLVSSSSIFLFRFVETLLNQQAIRCLRHLIIFDTVFLEIRWHNRNSHHFMRRLRLNRSLRGEGLIRLAYCNNGAAVSCEGRAMIVELRVPKGNANRTDVRSDLEQTALRTRTQ